VPLESLDLSRRFVEVRLLDARAGAPLSSPLGDRAAGAPADRPAGQLADRPTAAPADRLAHQLALAAVLTAAETVGAMAFELEMTVQYAKDRIAFGRPIGSFQAIKHLLADTSLDLEMSKALVLAAARSLGEGDPYGRQLASMAKAFVGDCGVVLAQSCFQVFGGIGYTWEHDQHLFLRRITTDAAFHGDPTWHREHLCQLAGV
jgi:alkylation response protein AidB-like acyl-CoA dehydrogenase